MNQEEKERKNEEEEIKNRSNFCPKKNDKRTRMFGSQKFSLTEPGIRTRERMGKRASNSFMIEESTKRGKKKEEEKEGEKEEEKEGEKKSLLFYNMKT